MRATKDSGFEWIGDIPCYWKIDKLKYHLRRNEPRNPGDVVVLSLYRELGVIPKDSRDDNHNVTSEDTSKYKYVRPGDFVINKMKAWQGSVAVSEYEGIVSPAYFVYEFTDDTIFKRYFHYLLRSCYKDEFMRLSGGIRVGQWDLPADALENTPILIPPMDEQCRIADFLDAKCAEIDALTADIQTQIDTLEQYKRSVITETVTKGLNPNAEMKDSGIQWVGNMPSSWSVLKGKYMFAQRSLRGNSIELQLLSPTQKFGVIPQTRYEELSGMNAVKLNEKADLSLFKTIHKGDFCISLRSFQGGFEYSEYEGVVSPAYQVFYPTVKIADGYYRYLFKEQGFIEKMNSYTMTLRDGKNIAFSDFGNTYIPYPPLTEQSEIAAYLNSKCAQINALITEKQQQLATLDEYKKSLIFEYVTGKKEVPLS